MTASAPQPSYRPWTRDSRYLVGEDGTIIGPSGCQVGSAHRQGYTVISFRTEDGRRSSTSAHAMVCETFHGDRPDGNQAAHGDGDPTHNAATNLRWATVKNNSLDRHRHGTAGNRLTAERVAEIRAASGETPRPSQRALARRFGVSQPTVCHILTGRTWSVPAA